MGFRPVISQKAKCEFITLKHDSMNVYINWITFRQFWVHFLSKWVKKLMILQHFFSNLLSKITSLKCNTTLLYRRAKMLFGPYFHEKTWSAASYCSLKVTKPPESFEIEAKYTKDGRKININLIYFLCTSPTYPSHCATKLALLVFW